MPPAEPTKRWTEPQTLKGVDALNSFVFEGAIRLYPIEKPTKPGKARMAKFSVAYTPPHDPLHTQVKKKKGELVPRGGRWGVIGLFICFGDLARTVLEDLLPGDHVIVRGNFQSWATSYGMQMATVADTIEVVKRVDRPAASIDDSPGEIAKSLL